MKNRKTTVLILFCMGIILLNNCCQFPMAVSCSSNNFVQLKTGDWLINDLGDSINRVPMIAYLTYFPEPDSNWTKDNISFKTREKYIRSVIHLKGRQLLYNPEQNLSVSIARQERQALILGDTIATLFYDTLQCQCTLYSANTPDIMNKVYRIRKRKKKSAR